MFGAIILPILIILSGGLLRPLGEIGISAGQSLLEERPSIVETIDPETGKFGPVASTSYHLNSSAFIISGVINGIVYAVLFLIVAFIFSAKKEK